MPVARLLRILTLVVSFVALQLTLLSGGPGCPMPAGGEASGAMGPMAGMEMLGDVVGRAGPERVSAAVTADGRSVTTQATTQAASHSSPCENATAPQRCPTMAPCLFAMVLPTADAEATLASEPSSLIVALALTPPSISAAPELPPPRA